MARIRLSPFVPRSLGARISFGFTVVLVLHILVAVQGHVGLRRAEAAADTRRAQGEAVLAILEIDRRVDDLQKRAHAFKYTGDPRLARDVRERARELIDSLRSSTADGMGVDALVLALEAYQADFEIAAQDRDQREEILTTEVGPAQGRAVCCFADLTAGRWEGASDGVPARLAAASAAFQAAGHDFQSYLLDPDGSLCRSMRERLRRARAELGHLRRSALPGASRDTLEELVLTVQAWENGVFRVVNATRSYLHLVNVVLAGHAHEFRKISRMHRESALASVEALDQALASEQRVFRGFADLISVLTIVVGVAASTWISRWVTQQLSVLARTLSGITEPKEGPTGRLQRRAGANVLAQAQRAAKEQRRLNHDLADSVAELSARNDELERFTYSASHDLRAPLRSISLLVSWIEEDTAGTLTDESRENFEMLRGRTKRLEGYLDGLLEYSIAGRVEDVCETVDVREVVEEITESFASHPGVVFDLEDCESGVRVLAPRVAVQKVVQNLVSNAIKHHHRHDPHLWIQCESVDGDARITVRDDGPGIEPQFQERAFEIFQTAERRDVKESSGLGLAIVTKLCETNGASVQLMSDGRSGCTFTVHWPACPPRRNRCQTPPQGCSSAQREACRGVAPASVCTPQFKAGA